MLKNTKTAAKVSAFIGSIFGRLPLHPSHYTILSVVAAIAGCLLWMNGMKAYGLVAFLVALLVDAIDGAVARAKNLVTEEGAFLDGISDRLVEFFMLFAFLFSGFASDMQIAAALVTVLFFGTCMTAFVKAYSSHSGLLAREHALRMPGFLERGERVALLVLAALLSTLGYGGDAELVIYLAAVLSVVTFMQRIWLATRPISSSPAPPRQAPPA